jgi:hypothetical protein
MIVFCRILLSSSTGLLGTGRGRRDRPPHLSGQLQLRTGILAAAILAGLRESGLQVLILGALRYLPLGELHIATSENAAST